MTNERVLGLSLSHFKSLEALHEPLKWGHWPKSESKLAIVFHQNGLSTVSARLIAPGSRLVEFRPPPGAVARISEASRAAMMR